MSLVALEFSRSYWNVVLMSILSFFKRVDTALDIPFLSFIYFSRYNCFIMWSKFSAGGLSIFSGRLLMYYFAGSMLWLGMSFCR